MYLECHQMRPWIPITKENREKTRNECATRARWWRWKKGTHWKTMRLKMDNADGCSVLFMAENEKNDGRRIEPNQWKGGEEWMRWLGKCWCCCWCDKIKSRIVLLHSSAWDTYQVNDKIRKMLSESALPIFPSSSHVSSLPRPSLDTLLFLIFFFYFFSWEQMSVERKLIERLKFEALAPASYIDILCEIQLGFKHQVRSEKSERRTRSFSVIKYSLKEREKILSGEKAGSEWVSLGGRLSSLTPSPHSLSSFFTRSLSGTNV